MFKNLYPLFIMPNNFTAFIISKHVSTPCHPFSSSFSCFCSRVLKLLFVPVVLISRKTNFCTRALFTYARQTKRSVPHWRKVHFYRGRQTALIRSSLQLLATPMIPSSRAKRSYAHLPRDSGCRRDVRWWVTMESRRY